MNTMLILDAIIVVFGAYLTFVAWQMKKKGEINPLVIAKEEITRCKDKKGFISYISPKIMIFAITIMIVGMVGIAGDLFIEIPYLSYIILAVFLIAFFIYIAQMRKARTDFFY